MSYKFCRIDLSKTNYSIIDNWKVLDEPNYEELIKIYHTYCRYKKFKSVMPLFKEDFEELEILGYYNNNKIVAFSMITKYPSSMNVYADQFAWDYKDPSLRLGINSLKSECAYYKSLGYKYYYLGQTNKYKEQIDGFEILGPV